MRKNFNITKEKHLALHGVDLIELCDKYDPPLFVFDEDCLANNFETFRQAFESNYPKVIVCFSVKTNNNPAICKVLQKKGAYAEVASELDLYAADTAGFSGDHIIFDGAYKPEKALRKALEKELLLVNVESFTELERLDKIARKMGVKQAVGLRINAFKRRSFLANINPKYLEENINCHPHCRFGFPLNQAYSIFEQSLQFKNLSIEGIMTHPYYGAIETLSPVMHEIYEKLGIELKYLNVGGGFKSGTTTSVNYSSLIRDLLRQKVGSRSKLDDKGKTGGNIESTAKHLIGNIKSKLSDLPEPTLITEPGSFIAGSSGILLLRVDHTKTAGGYKWVTVNGGTNLAPIANIFTRREIVVANKADNPQEELVNIAGPLLYSDDILAQKTYLPKVKTGDILAIFDLGAYTLSSSTQFLYPRPAAVLVNSEKEVKLIREKESCEDVLRKDKLV